MYYKRRDRIIGRQLHSGNLVKNFIEGETRREEYIN